MTLPSPRLLLGGTVILTLVFGAGIVLFLALAGAPRRALASAPEQRSVSSGPPSKPVAAVPPLRIAMSAAFATEAGAGSFRAIARYVGEKLGRPVEFVTGLSYATINEVIDAGVVQLAFLCGLPYVLKADTPTPTVRLVAAPVMTGAHYGGEPKYFSYVIVRQGLAARSFADLRGLRFAYNDELSNSGYNMPRAKLVELGETHGFFGSTVRSGSHEESLRMVADGEADAACVDSLVFDYHQERGAPQLNRVRVIERLGPAGIPPLVASTHLDEDLYKQVRDVLLCMHDDDAGRRILAEALIARFVAVDDSNYEDIRRMWQAAKSAGFLKLQ